MPGRVLRLYQRKKIININANIVLAGLLAVVIAAWPVYLVAALLEEHLGRKIIWLESIVAALIDGVVDVAIYFLLHWIANHWKPFTPVSEADRADRARKKENFWKTATFIQAERYLLSPIFYGVAMGGMWALQVYGGAGSKWAFVISFSAAIIVTRIIHTFWGLRSGTFRDAPGARPEGAD